MIEIIENLLRKELAYQKGGNIYFRTQKDPEYGKLSRYNREKMILLSKERGANPEDPNKEDPLDFILWQKSLPDEPSWHSPWGQGRPGWHIECSAMAYKYIDKKLDIHGGGTDLLYPHHESEIAQSEAFTGEKPFVKYWLHTGAVRYQGEKMSKSLGNLVMVSDLLKKYSPDVIRYLLLSHHYREPWEFTEEHLTNAEEDIQAIQEALKKQPTENNEVTMTTDEFISALDDDMNTPEALQIILRLAQEIQARPTKKTQQNLWEMLQLLGFTNRLFR
jgi:L-cysteine:1D-myo-inositol 2-amino-2-deoxy-alpha-D-glucopyranoside ligase